MPDESKTYSMPPYSVAGGQIVRGDRFVGAVAAAERLNELVEQLEAARREADDLAECLSVVAVRSTREEDRLKEQLGVYGKALHDIADAPHSGGDRGCGKWKAIARRALESSPATSDYTDPDDPRNWQRDIEEVEPDPAKSLDDIDPKDLGDGMEATVEPGGEMIEADLDALDPASEPRVGLG